MQMRWLVGRLRPDGGGGLYDVRKIHIIVNNSVQMLVQIYRELQDIDWYLCKRVRWKVYGNSRRSGGSASVEVLAIASFISHNTVHSV